METPIFQKLVIILMHNEFDCDFELLVIGLCSCVTQAACLLVCESISFITHA